MDVTGVAKPMLVIEAAGELPGIAADSSGIAVEVPDGKDGWTTLVTVWPRRRMDRQAVDLSGNDRARLVFHGAHLLRSVALMNVSVVVTPEALTLTSAVHSRLGTVTSAVSASGGSSTTLTAGDALVTTFGNATLASGKVRDWWLTVRKDSGGPGSEQTGAGLVALAPVARYVLSPARPNPGRTSVTIGYALARAGLVKLQFYDIGGRLVRTIEPGVRPAGAGELRWDLRDRDGAPVPPGLYFYRMTSGNWRSERRLVVLPR